MTPTAGEGKRGKSFARHGHTNNSINFFHLAKKREGKTQVCPPRLHPPNCQPSTSKYLAAIPPPSLPTTKRRRRRQPPNQGSEAAHFIIGSEEETIFSHRHSPRFRRQRCCPGYDEKCSFFSFLYQRSGGGSLLRFQSGRKKRFNPPFAISDF